MANCNELPRWSLRGPARIALNYSHQTFYLRMLLLSGLASGDEYSATTTYCVDAATY